MIESIDNNMNPNDEIRYRILNFTYARYHEDPGRPGIDRTTMLELLQVPENAMDANVLYLEQKSLLKLLKSMGALWVVAEITAFGIDVIENKEKYKDAFPFIQVQIVGGDNIGTMVQSGAGSKITVNQINEAFQKAREINKAIRGLTEEEKKQVEDNLTTLEKEAHTEKPEQGKIHKSWEWLKRNAPWLVPILKDIVVEIMKGTG